MVLRFATMAMYWSLPSTGTFNILVYADEDVQVPTTWEDSDPNLIAGGGEHVKLRSFDTSMHKIDALVAYRVMDDV